MNRFLSLLTGSAPTLVDASGLLSGISCKQHHDLFQRKVFYAVPITHSRSCHADITTGHIMSLASVCPSAYPAQTINSKTKTHKRSNRGDRSPWQE